MKLVTRSTMTVCIQFLFWWSVPFALQYNIPLCAGTGICLAEDPVAALYILATILMPLLVLVIANVLHFRISFIKSFCYSGGALLLMNAITSPKVEDDITPFAALLFGITCTTFFGRDTLHNRNFISQTILCMFFVSPWLGLHRTFSEGMDADKPILVVTHAYNIVLGLLAMMACAATYIFLHMRSNTIEARSS